MAHMQASTGVGEHRQAIKLVLTGLVLDLKTVIFLPIGLYGRFDIMGGIIFFHLSFVYRPIWRLVLG
jgi:hypothetical protein